VPALASRRFIDDLHAPFWVLVAGVLLGLSFPPSPLYGLAYVALVPVLIRWSRLPLGWMLLRETYSTFLIMTAIAGHWVLLHESALTALTSGLGLLLIPVPMTLPFVASALVKRRLGVRLGFVALVAFWLAMEYVVTHGPGALPWLLLGNTQAAAFPINQLADLGGVGGLTLWIWLVNGAVFWAFETRSVAIRTAMAACAIALFAAPFAYASWRLPQLETPTAHAEVALVQPAVSPKQWADVRSGTRVDLMASLATEALPSAPTPGDAPPDLLSAEAAGTEASRPSLLIWPETALPVYADARRQRALYERLEGWARRHDVALLTGAITRYDSAPALTVDAVVAEETAQVTPYYNSALLFNAGDGLQQYDKVHMIPFAERVPLMEWRPALAALGVASGGVGGYGTGARQGLMERADSRFGTLICYESLFGDYTRSLVADGAEFLVVLAQDGWWGRSAGYLQHFALTRLRAIETRRAVVMSTVTGRSGLILPDGRAPETTGWMEQTVHQASVPLLHTPTFYTRHGDWVGRGGLALSALLLLLWGFLTLFFPQRRTPEGRRQQRRASSTVQLAKLR
jgi:apolipoprotein N-acyltransferase